MGKGTGEIFLMIFNNQYSCVFTEKKNNFSFLFTLKVCQWLLALGMESYITLFMDKTITGAALLNLDSSGLKDLGIKNKDDREKIKKKIKELKAHNDREKKDMEKEKSRREKLLKKAEKAIGKAKK